MSSASFLGWMLIAGRPLPKRGRIMRKPRSGFRPGPGGVKIARPRLQYYITLLVQSKGRYNGNSEGICRVLGKRTTRKDFCTVYEVINGNKDGHLHGANRLVWQDASCFFPGTCTVQAR